MPEQGYDGLSSTSFVILGLLCVQDWSAYDLAQQMERGWADVWPRASSGIYAEPKKLVDHGLAVRRQDEATGRVRSVYSVTPAGRAALRWWLAQPALPPRLESEPLVRVLFADHGPPEALLVAIQSVREHAVLRSRELLHQGERDYVDAPGPFPERRHLIQLAGGFLAEYFASLIQWAEWAELEVQKWQSPSDPQEVDELARQVRRMFQANLG